MPLDILQSAFRKWKWETWKQKKHEIYANYYSQCNRNLLLGLVILITIGISCGVEEGKTFSATIGLPLLRHVIVSTRQTTINSFIPFRLCASLNWHVCGKYSLEKLKIIINFFTPSDQCTLRGWRGKWENRFDEFRKVLNLSHISIIILKLQIANMPMRPDVSCFFSWT